jgi:hypothetical protein
MSQTWSIKIVATSNGIRFDPDVYGIEPGQPLIAEVSDLVSWNNQTRFGIAIQVQSPTGGIIFGLKIPPLESSSPGYVIQADDVDKKDATDVVVGTIDYYGAAGSKAVKGQITVVKS